MTQMKNKITKDKNRDNRKEQINETKLKEK